ncbi:hypothetical protein ACTA71_001050 [Dictyostelium dimigraforme]
MSTQKSSRSSSSGSSMSLIIGFSRSIEKGSFGWSFANYLHLVLNINTHGEVILDII